MENQYKKANAYFATDHQDLQYIFAKIRKLNEINKKVVALIDPQISRHCQVANVSGNCLVIMAANGSAATHLRFQAPDLLKKIQQDPTLRHIKEIQAKVGAPHAGLRDSQLKKIPASVRGLSPETAALILSFAESLEDEKLREVMQRIAGHTKEW